MILILSNEIDVSTNFVIDFMDYKNYNFSRINPSTNINIISISLEELSFSISINGDFFSFNASTSFWYRRGYFNTLSYSDNFILHSPLNKEGNTIKQFLHFFLSSNNSLGSLKKEIENNKLIDLFTAKSIGLDIPLTKIVSSKFDLNDFMEKCNKKTITKNIHNRIKVTIGERIFEGNSTEIINQKDIDNLNDSFAPILAQELLDKSYEIRSFYLKGTFYSMAIFSQNNEKTKLDYRNYDREKPNRNVPVKLPDELKEKLHQFMIASDLGTGSIDIVVTKDGRYVFLEVNPVGQFGWLSVNCNYYIEEKIVNYLAHGQTS